MSDSNDITVREANAADYAAVRALIEPFVQQQKVLPRTLEELHGLWPNSFVAEAQGCVVGFVVLDVYSEKLAEIRSLVVAEGHQDQGIGKLLVNACIELARERDVLEVMAISSSETFFQACGFDYTLPGEKKALFVQIHPWRH